MPGFLRISHPDFPNKSGFRIRTNSDIPEVIARISPHFTSGFSGQIQISHPDKFGLPGGDCPDLFAFHIRIFRTNPDRRNKQQASKTGFFRISHPDCFGDLRLIRLPYANPCFHYCSNASQFLCQGALRSHDASAHTAAPFHPPIIKK